MSTVLGCIADDFTGATDLAGILARSGESVSLRMGVPNEPASDTETSSFEVIALKTRTASKEMAIKEALEALAWLKHAGATHFYWKYCSTFDSTDEGNIGPVSEALMQALDTSQTIYCPAFPENGRSIFMGHLFVGEQLLADSPMKDHPLTPMRESNLVKVLQPQVSKPVGLVNRLTVEKGSEAIQNALQTLHQAGHAHVVVDAVSDQDLSFIAQATHKMPLMTGGSALALALPKLYRSAGLLTETVNKAEVTVSANRSIILSGSCSQMTRQQVSAVKDDIPSFCLDPLVLAEQGSAEVLAWLEALPVDQVKMVYATAEPESVRAVQDKLGVQAAGELVEQCLAEVAQHALRLGTDAFVVAGGETSGAITQALDVNQLNVLAEVSPGVPWTVAQAKLPDDDEIREIALTLKSGNFGDEDFFTKSLDVLKSL